MQTYSLLNDGYKRKYACVSHRWMKHFHPDPTGTQLEELQGFARASVDIKYFWVDYLSMPQEWMHEDDVLQGIEGES